MLTDIIDIHAHILPGVDDGAADWPETRQMLQLAYQQGIRTIVATPHYTRLRQGDRKQLGIKARQLTIEAEAIASDFRIYLGQEILYFDSLAECLKRGEALTLAGTRYVLVEFMPDVTYRNLHQWVRKLLLSGYIPVIAHVERYEALRKTGRLSELIAAGCYLQMNYSSLEGSIFNPTTRWSRRRLMDNEIHFLGTDMHHRDYRSPSIQKSFKWLELRCERKQVEALTRDHAGRMLADRPCL